MTVRHDRGGRTKTGASPTTSSQPPSGSVRPGPRAGVAVAPPEARPRPCVHESVVDLVQTVSGAELCSKRVAALSTLGVHTLADLRLLSEAHLRTEAGFTLTETLKLKHRLAAESAADAPRATPTKVRKRQPPERGSGPTEAKRASTQAMQNVMAGSDPATWVVTHTPQSRFTQQEISFLLSLSHDMLYELPWDSRSSSSARASKSLSIGDRQCRTLQAVASHFGIRAHASVAPWRLPWVIFVASQASKPETIHALLALQRRPGLVRRVSLPCRLFFQQCSCV